MSNETGYHQCNNQLIKPNHNLPKNERNAIKDLRNNNDKYKKADKRTTTVNISRHHKIKGEQVHLDNLHNCRPLKQPIVEEKAKKLISQVY